MICRNPQDPLYHEKESAYRQQVALNRLPMTIVVEDHIYHLRVRRVWFNNVRTWFVEYVQESGQGFRRSQSANLGAAAKSMLERLEERYK